MENYSGEPEELSGVGTHLFLSLQTVVTLPYDLCAFIYLFVCCSRFACFLWYWGLQLLGKCALEARPQSYTRVCKALRLVLSLIELTHSLGGLVPHLILIFHCGLIFRSCFGGILCPELPCSHCGTFFFMPVPVGLASCKVFQQTAWLRRSVLDTQG
jgi:hypothetical protein